MSSIHNYGSLAKKTDKPIFPEIIYKIHFMGNDYRCA